MTQASQHLPQRWQKLLLGLGSAAILSLLLAVIVQLNDYERTVYTFKEREMFPDLGERLDQISKVIVQTADEKFEIVKHEDGSWRLPTKQGFWADTDYVRQLLLAMRDMTLTDEKTALPNSHSVIGLVDPASGGVGARLVLAGASSKEPLADAIFGNNHSRVGNESVYYVRYANDPQTYLASGRLALKKSAQDWLDLSVVEINRVQVKSVAMAPVGSDPYTLDRPAPEGEFALSPMPEGREVKSQYALNSVAFSLVTMNIEDVARALPDGAEALGAFTYTLYSGVQIRGEVYGSGSADSDSEEAGDSHWVRFELLSDSQLAADDPKAGEAQAVVSRFKERAEGWVFAVPQFKVDQFTKPKDDLLADESDNSTAEDGAVPPLDLNFGGQDLISPPN